MASLISELDKIDDPIVGSDLFVIDRNNGRDSKSVDASQIKEYMIGNIDDLDGVVEPDYSIYWIPGTGHPEGYVNPFSK